ncbi:CBS domain-containing protein [Idiomarina xiamenensis]|uniref:CBS domain-containing protein n=1 Tax=Idiomarina xiamenensis 10-D-4 TaxID=740709 RepID=K2LAS3_9GAMM|nr:CBS domain-containing protein [Idiomarina xiamenensis]EKE86920.1 hypothetical protein A10D4_01722 [Idiomarina xiamenensis 10-D-4]
MKSVKVSDYMTRYPVIFTTQMTIEKAVEELLRSQQRGGPVVNAQQRVVGFLSEQDCLAAMLRATYHQEQSALVEDCMTTPVLTVRSDMSILDLAEQMQVNKPKLYPVIDENNRLTGLIGRSEVLRAMDLCLGDGYRRGGG